MGYKHGGKGTRLYRIWKAMRSRCNNPSSTAYANYGGRGIRVCDEWNDFNRFHDWAESNGYEEWLTIEREDNDKGYSPENCHWATHAEQTRNQRSNRYINYNGETKLLTDWATEKGLRFECVHYRLAHGWSIEDALETPSAYRPPRLVTANGVTRSVAEWAAETGIKDTTIRERLKAGWPEEKAVGYGAKNGGDTP